MMYKLYLITNLINKKRYAGITSRRIQQRFTQHCSQGNMLTSDIMKYGRENFTLEVVASSDSLEVIKKFEVKFISKLNLTDRNIGYNISEGGDLTTKTELTRIKISERLKGKPKSQSHRAKIKINAVERGEELRGKRRPTFSEDWKSNMRRSKKGTKLSPVHKANISKGIRNSERYAASDKGIYFRSNNPNTDPIIKEKIARTKWKPVYCVNNGICYLSLKSAAEDLSLRANAIATSLFRCTTINKYKFYYIYK